MAMWNRRWLDPVVLAILVAACLGLASIASATASADDGDLPLSHANVCNVAMRKVPLHAINRALVDPLMYAGYMMRCNPNVPASPWNTPRMILGLENPNVPYHPLFNALEWKCGCP